MLGQCEIVLGGVPCLRHLNVPSRPNPIESAIRRGAPHGTCLVHAVGIPLGAALSKALSGQWRAYEGKG